MGVELKTISLKWNEETCEAVSTLLEMFDPFFEGRSQLSRFVFPAFLKIVRTKGMLEVLTASLQGLHRNTSSHQRVLEFPDRSAAQGNQAGSEMPLGPCLDKTLKRNPVSLRPSGVSVQGQEMEPYRFLPFRAFVFRSPVRRIA